MALPIWGIWMKKVIADGTLGISESDVFSVPENMPDCTSSAGADASGDRDLEEYYFD